MGDDAASAPTWIRLDLSDAPSASQRQMKRNSGTMKITIEDRAQALGNKLRDRLALAAELRCPEHGEKVVAVAIAARENGWFDARWTTCCEKLEKQAKAIVKERC